MSEEKTSIEQVLGADLDVIKERLIIEGNIEMLSQMHIGVGGDDIEFSPESGILRTTSYLPDIDNIPYIPNSTIKGNLRSEAETIANTLQDKHKNVKYICDSYPGKPGKSHNNCRIEIKRKTDTVFIDPCIVCRIFGGSDLASHIIISDAFPNKDDLELFKSELKPGIAIDREKQVSRDRSLFFIEILHPGAKFEFKMIINNISKGNNEKQYEFKLLRTLFKLIDLGFITFGGKKSTGMGKFVLKDVVVRELKEKQDFMFPEDVEPIDLNKYFEI